jgi:hypothetical protein
MSLFANTVQSTSLCTVHARKCAKSIRCVYVYVNVHVYLYMYIHTHIYIYLRKRPQVKHDKSRIETVESELWVDCHDQFEDNVLSDRL